jgi:hypothetical protein
LRSWRYRLGHQKLSELGAALGVPADRSPGMHAVFFMFGLVPALRQILIDPEVSPRRGELRLAKVSTEWSGTVDAEADIVGTVATSKVGAGLEGAGSLTSSGDALCAFRIELTSATAVTAPLEPTSPGQVELPVDAGRALAFAAATWDLNPSYWDRDFAASIGLTGRVAPPGLAAAWLLHLAETDLVGPMKAWEVSFYRTPRVGETIAATFAPAPGGVSAIAATPEGPAVSALLVPGTGRGHE